MRSGFAYTFLVKKKKDSTTATTTTITTTGVVGRDGSPLDGPAVKPESETGAEQREEKESGLGGVFVAGIIGVCVWVIATTDSKMSSFTFHRSISEQPVYRGPQSTFTFYDNPYRLEIVLDNSTRIVRPFIWGPDRGLCFVAFDRSYCGIPAHRISNQKIQLYVPFNTVAKWVAITNKDK